MNVQLTNAGAALLAANTGPITLTAFKLGTAFGYVPDPTDTNIHGALVYQGVPSAPVASNANVVKYSAYLDYDLGSFAFGEIGLFTSTGVLFALATGNEQLFKIALSSIGAGNSIRIDIYLSMVNANYEMWLDLAESNNEFRAAVLGSVDQLPPPKDATPNLYIVSGAASNQSAFQAYTDRSGLWNFDAYEYSNQASATIVACDFQSVTIALSEYVPGMSPAFFGQVILEFSTGALFGICRYVKTAVISGNQVTLGFNNALMIKPIVGDKFVVFGRQALSTTIPNLPIATSSALGAIIVGDTLTVDATGLVNVKTSSFPVSSVNDKTGDVQLVATDIPGFAVVARTGSYNDLNDRPPIYTLPVATTTVLGGVKAPTTDNLAIAGDGTIDLTFSPVKTVNGQVPDPSTGNVDVVYNLPVATTSVLGGVKASSTITVAADGTMGIGFAPVLTVNGQSPNGAGAVTLPDPIGLVKPTKINTAVNIDTIQTTGLYFVLDADASSITNLPSASGGTLDVEPLTTTAAGGDVIQRYQTATSLYFRRLTQSLNTWSAWVAVTTTATLPLATAASVGVVKIGAGLSVDGTGNVTADVASVNGHSDTNIILNAEDVGAVDVSLLGADGGIPQLDAAPVPPVTPDTDPYTYGRMLFYQNTLGTWWNAGTWDANANNVTLINQKLPDGTPIVITGQQLLNAGQQIIDITYAGYVPQNGDSPNLQTVSGEGMVYRVTTAGTTSLDGNAQWDVDDLVVAVAGKWIKISTSFSNTVFSAGTF